MTSLPSVSFKGGDVVDEGALQKTCSGSDETSRLSSRAPGATEDGPARSIAGEAASRCPSRGGRASTSRSRPEIIHVVAPASFTLRDELGPQAWRAFGRSTLAQQSGVPGRSEYRSQLFSFVLSVGRQRGSSAVKPNTGRAWNESAACMCSPGADARLGVLDEARPAIGLGEILLRDSLGFRHEQRRRVDRMKVRPAEV